MCKKRGENDENIHIEAIHSNFQSKSLAVQILGFIK
jgi:hypothetical protein